MRIILLLAGVFFFNESLKSQEKKDYCEFFKQFKKEYSSSNLKYEKIYGRWRNVHLVKNNLFQTSCKSIELKNANSFELLDSNKVIRSFSYPGERAFHEFDTKYSIVGQTLIFGDHLAGDRYVILYIDPDLMILRWFETWSIGWGNKLSSISQEINERTERRDEILIFERQL